MPQPTLMIKGRLRAPNGDPKLQAELDNYVPYQYIIKWIRDRADATGITNRVLVAKAETASGKSTALVAEIYRDLIYNAHESRGVICTQPRTLTAIRNVLQIVSIADYGTFLRLGETIGWSTRFKKLRARKFGLLSATIGTLTQQLSIYSDEEIMKLYKFILIDETHERDLETDITLYMLKNFLRRNQGNPRCPFVILMSATFEPAKFLRYYELDPVMNFVWCEGRSVGIEPHWDWNQDRIVNNYPQAAADVVEQIIRENPHDEPEKGDILIFMPGRAEIKDTAKWLSKLNDKLDGVMSIMRIDSDAQKTENLDYKKLDIPLKNHSVFANGKLHTPTRRVIIATNFAETGITITSLKYVIDSGYNKEIEYNPNYNLRALIARPVAQSRIEQRMGRAGRIFLGHFYPLYPMYIYKMLPKNQLPQILTEDISLVMLDIIIEQLKEKRMRGQKTEFLVSDIDMIDVPTPDALHSALEKLYVLGFISPRAVKYSVDTVEMINDLSVEDSFGLTRLGAAAANFSMISPENIRMILGAYSWEASVLDMITIAAFVSIGPKSFIIESDSEPTPINWAEIYKLGAPGFLHNANEMYKINVLIADEFIQGLFLFKAVKQIIAQSENKKMISDLQKWCEKASLNYDIVITFIRERDNIIEQMLTAEMDIFLFESNAIANAKSDTFMDIITRIKYCIYDGYRLNIIVRENDKYYTLHGHLPVNAARFSIKHTAEKGAAPEHDALPLIMPQILLYKELGVKYNMESGIYNVVADRLSTMDGFVNVDFAFAN